MSQKAAGSIVWLLALGVLVLAAIAVAALATRHGVSLGSDSAAYIAAARNLLNGFGLSWLSGASEVRPMVLHAPLYSLLLAGFGALSVDPLLAARGINILAFGVSAAAFGLLLHRLTDNRPLALFGVLLLMVTGELLRVFAWAMSDPLYIALSLLALALTARFLARRHWSVLAAAAAVASAAYLARYVGLSLIVAHTLVLTAAPGVPRARRWRDGVIFLLVGVVPIGVWFARNVSLTGQMAGRTLGMSGLSLLGGFEQAASIVFNWFIPLRWVEWLQSRPPLLGLAALIGVGALLLVAALSYRRWSRRTESERKALSVSLALYALTFIGLMGFSYSFSRPGTDLDERTLAPLYPALLALLVAVFAWLWSSRRAWLRVIVVIACVALLRNKAVYGYWVVDGYLDQAEGYASRAWHQSPTIAALVELSPDLVYTDDIAAVYLLATPRVYLVPLRIESATGESRADYPKSLETMRSRIDQGNTLLVLFRRGPWPAELAPLEDLTTGLRPLAVFQDGTIFGPDLELGDS